MHQPQQVGPNMMASVGGVPNHSNNVNRRNRVRLSLHSLMIEKLPISEAAQLEMKSLTNKTPVSILQELLSRRGTTPKYELIQVEGAIHEPIFRYRVTVPDIVGLYLILIMHYCLDLSINSIRGLTIRFVQKLRISPMINFVLLDNVNITISRSRLSFTYKCIV